MEHVPHHHDRRPGHGLSQRQARRRQRRARELLGARQADLSPRGRSSSRRTATRLRFRHVYVHEIPRDPRPSRRTSCRRRRRAKGSRRSSTAADLAGWTGNTRGYTAENGRIVVHPELGGGNLYTEKDYEDFVLRFEFKLTPGANNGVGVRTPSEGDAAYEGLEIQILEDSAPMYWGLMPNQFHGSVYGIGRRRRLPETRRGMEQGGDHPGEGGRVKVNGTAVIDADLSTATDRKPWTAGIIRGCGGPRAASASWATARRWSSEGSG